MDEKTKKVEDLEQEIATTIEGQIKENQELKDRLSLQHALAEPTGMRNYCCRVNCPRRWTRNSPCPDIFSRYWGTSSTDLGKTSASL
jgi:hypothetical protein